MPEDSIEVICQTFNASATLEEQVFWKDNVLYNVAQMLYYRFEQLLDCYPNKPEITQPLLFRLRNIYETYSDMRSSRQARSALWHDMTYANISFIAMNRTSWIAEACVGDHAVIEHDLNLAFLDLSSQKPSIKRLAVICLAHFETRVAEQIAEKQAAKEAHGANFSPGQPGV